MSNAPVLGFNIHHYLNTVWRLSISCKINVHSYQSTYFYHIGSNPSPNHNWRRHKSLLSSIVPHRNQSTKWDYTSISVQLIPKHRTLTHIWQLHQYASSQSGIRYSKVEAPITHHKKHAWLSRNALSIPSAKRRNRATCEWGEVPHDVIEGKSVCRSRNRWFGLYRLTPLRWVTVQSIIIQWAH